MARRPRLYADVLIGKSQSYFDYENVAIEWGQQEDFEVVRKLGRGKYSEVFLGLSVKDLSEVVIKVLKPVRKEKIKREFKVLQVLQGCRGVPRLLNIVRDPSSKAAALILEYTENQDFKKFFPKLTDFEIRYYLYELLFILDHAHSCGVMHRDVKPGNLMIDHHRRKLALIDWGLAEFYVPATPYHVRVASRYYKAPELLLNNTFYDYSLDMWSFGCVLAGLVFRKEPFFHGHDNQDQLNKVINVLGTANLLKYTEKFDLEQQATVDVPEKPWDRFISKTNRELASSEAIDLISRVLVYDHSARLLPKEAMEHEYFLPVRAMWDSIGSGEATDNETACILQSRIISK